MNSRPLAALAVILLSSQAAHAGPNEDLTSAIGRCASLADNTARLVCYDQIGAQVKAGTPPAQVAAQTIPQQFGSEHLPPPAAPPAAPPPTAQPAAAPSPATVPPAQVASAQPAAPSTQVAAQTPPTKEEQGSWFGISEWFGGGSTSPAAQMTPQQFGSENLPRPPAAPGVPVPLDSITATVADYAFNPFGRFTVFLDNGQIWQQLQSDTDKARFSKSKKDQVTIARGILGSYNLEVVGHNGLYKVKRIK